MCLWAIPNWNADLPMPLYTFLEEYDFSGKTIIPFTTHGGSRLSIAVWCRKEKFYIIEDGDYEHGTLPKGVYMEIRILRYFLTVVREESITRASEVLHITQPTLSRQLSQMEEELGVKLFRRGTRKISLTNEGILLRRRAEEILQLVDKTEKELVEQEEQVEGKVSIGCGEIASVQLLPELFRSFREKYPRVSFDIFTATADLVKEQLDKGLLDLGLLLEPVDMEKYDFIRFDIKENWVVLMRPDDPLAKRECITAKDLSSKPLILPRRMQVQNELASWFGDYYEGLDVVFTSNLNTNSAIMVESGLAYSIVIEGAVCFWDQKKITYRPLTPSLTATSVLAWKRGQPFSLAATKFIEFSKCFLGMDKS